MNRALVVVMFAVGCKGGGKKVEKPAEPTPTPVAKDQEPVPPPAPAGPSCADRAARLGKRMTELAAATPGFMPLIKDLSAPDAPGGKPFDTRGPVLAVTKAGKVWTHGQEVTTIVADYLDTIDKQTAEDHALAGEHISGAHWPLYIWADRAAPASAVAAIVTAAAAGHWQPRLLVTGAAVPPEDPALLAVPAVSSSAGKLPTDEPEGTAFVVSTLRQSMAPCSDAITAFAVSSSKGDVALQTTGFVTDLPTALTKCDCKMADADLFEWGVHLWFGATAPGLAWVDLPKLAKGEKKTIGELVAK